MIPRYGFALLAVTLLAGSTLGCRTVWIHPEATAEKYSDDLFFCRYGVERIAWNAAQASHPEPTPPVAAPPRATPDRSWALSAAPAPGPMRRGWKHCMVNLGWDTSASSRSDQPWRTPRPQTKRYGKR